MHNPQQSRFEIYLDDTLAGYAEYNETPGVRNFNHTLTYPQFRGHGLAAQVVEYALDSSRADGFEIVPTCWYVNDFINARARVSPPEG
nr:GNAT family N-acetyltransferase [Antrihabitans stalactiti]